MRVTYSPRSLRQLEEIHDYITEHSPLGAAAVITRIRERCEMVGELPGMGTATDQAGVAGDALSVSDFLRDPGVE